MEVKFRIKNYDDRRKMADILRKNDYQAEIKTEGKMPKEEHFIVVRVC